MNRTVCCFVWYLFIAQSVHAIAEQYKRHYTRPRSQHHREDSSIPANTAEYDHEQSPRDKCGEPDMVHAATNPEWYIRSEEDIKNAKADWMEFMGILEKFEDTVASHSDGRGIVYCAGPKEFRQLLVSVRMLRALGCTLPIEVWHFPGELHSHHTRKLKALNAITRDISDPTLARAIKHNNSMPEPWNIKPTALLASSFAEVLYLDADNIPAADPTYLFDLPHYTTTGAMFWGDFWKTDPRNSIFKIYDLECYDEREFESGQLLVHKRKSWRALNLAYFMNTKHWLYYRLLFGDKDTFRFAFKATKSPYHFVKQNQAEVGFITEREKQFCGHSMGHFDPNGNLVFLHFHMLKYGDWKGPYDLAQLLNGQNGYSSLHPWTRVQQISDPTMRSFRPYWYVPFPQYRCLRYASKTDESKVVETQPFEKFVGSSFYPKFIDTDASILLERS